MATSKFCIYVYFYIVITISFFNWNWLTDCVLCMVSHQIGNRTLCHSTYICCTYSHDICDVVCTCIGHLIFTYIGSSSYMYPVLYRVHKTTIIIIDFFFFLKTNNKPDFCNSIEYNACMCATSKCVALISMWESRATASYVPTRCDCKTTQLAHKNEIDKMQIKSK